MERFSRLIPAVVILLSCTRLDPAQDVGTASGEFVSLRLSVPDIAASFKSGTQQHDTMVDSICVMEFDAAGNTVYSNILEYEPELVVPVLRNAEVRIHAVANPTNNLLEITTERELLEMQSLFAEADPARLEMIGSVSGVFNGGETVELSMECICARIQVDTTTFRISSTRYEYIQALMRYAHMERTPLFCSYALQPSEQLVDAYVWNIPAGISDGPSGPCCKSEENGARIWEYRSPWSLYALPNYSEDDGSRTVLTLEFRTLYLLDVYSVLDGIYKTETRYDDRHVKIFMPPVRPNTLYRISHLTINESKDKRLYIPASCDGIPGEDEPAEFEIRMEDLVTGEPLGIAKGEVVYE